MDLSGILYDEELAEEFWAWYNNWASDVEQEIEEEHSYLDEKDKKDGFVENLIEFEGYPDWIPRPKEKKKCTCGASSVGSGKHSSWCDAYEEEENEIDE